MTDKNTKSIPSEVQRQFLRRTPIKLKQFSRLLNDMVAQTIDPLRVKALLSQSTKTREACITQGFESTARLLNQLIKQLSMDDESIDSQKPLLKRLSKKLLEHSSKLELGVKPQKEVPAKVIKEVQPVDEVTNEPVEADEPLAHFDLYIDNGKLVFVKAKTHEPSLFNQELCDQFQSLGVESVMAEHLEDALTIAKETSGSIVIAELDLADELSVLNDEDIEINRIPLIFIADEDNQENRCKAIRNGGTGFMIEPISLSTICEQIERLYDRQANTEKRILVMEDSKAQSRYYEKVLNKGHFETLIVNNPAILLEAVRGFDPETILMDMQMPGSSGIELTQMIRQMPRYAHLPIIFLSAEENLRKQNQALMSGGTAFIVKPVQKEQLMFMARLYTQRFRDLAPQIDVNPDTNLPYGPQFKQMIAIETARMTRGPASSALAIIQLDEVDSLIANSNFSFINSAIQQLAQLLRKRLRKTDIIGHIENGQLAVILTSGKQANWVEILQDVQKQFSKLPFHLQHQDKSLTISIGLSALDTNYDAHQWLERSNQALSKASKAASSSIEWHELDEK